MLSFVNVSKYMKMLKNISWTFWLINKRIRFNYRKIIIWRLVGKSCRVVASSRRRSEARVRSPGRGGGALHAVAVVGRRRRGLRRVRVRRRLRGHARVRHGWTWGFYWKFVFIHFIFHCHTTNTLQPKLKDSYRLWTTLSGLIAPKLGKWDIY